MWKARTALPAIAALCLAACGAGGGGPPPPNRAPQVALPNGVQQAIQFHPFDYDVTRGGQAFVDPDGDALRYQIFLSPANTGLQVVGPRVVGQPAGSGAISVSVTAMDPAGASASSPFTILVTPNGVPQATGAREDKRVLVGESVAVDAAQAGAQLMDPDGDPLTLSVSLRGAPGLAVNGTQVTGMLAAVGAVEVTLTATDPYGASAQSVFLIAAPGAAAGSPVLPATPYMYRDEALPLPDDFRQSSMDGVPLWDMQPAGNRTSDAGAALGRVLFHDKRLSITHTVACASCHQREHGFASPQRFSTGVIGVPLTRNAMALGNARYNIHAAWFSDLRAFSLQEVARQALTRTDEMGSTLPAVEAGLRATPFYAPLFTAAFGTPDIDIDRVLRALEQYVQALISYRSKFDQACDAVGGVQPDCDLGLTAQEARGRALFASAGDDHIHCTQCHSLPAGANIWLANNGLDAAITDPGVGNGRFRPASLHNIALTAPYMHDGRFATLRAVIEHYDHGIVASPDLDPLLRNDDGSPRRMNLSEADKDALEAFLRTLTDDAMLADPRFSDPFDAAP